MARQTDQTLDRPVFDVPPRLALVVAPFYRDIADHLIAGATAEVEAAGGSVEVIEEIPPAVRLAWIGGDFDGFVALGCVIRGETSHYDTVCNDSSRGLMLLGLQGACIGNGILTVETMDQALVRADPAEMNKGGGAAAAALHMIALSRRFTGRRTGVGFLAAGLGLSGEGQA